MHNAITDSVSRGGCQEGFRERARRKRRGREVGSALRKKKKKKRREPQLKLKNATK